MHLFEAKMSSAQKQFDVLYSRAKPGDKSPRKQNICFILQGLFITIFSSCYYVISTEMLFLNHNELQQSPKLNPLVCFPLKK